MLNIKKINVADFSASNTADMQKLARSLNPFFDSISQLVKKGITVSEHLPFEYQTFEVTVDVSGTPTAPLKLPISLAATVQGMQVVQVSGGIPTATPFIVFTIDKNIATISHITSLPAGVKFKITAMVVS
jgi:hypothetical protein